MNKKQIGILLLALVILAVMLGASAETAAPRADETSCTASVSLSAGKSATFRCTAMFPQSSIYVSSCWLEVWMSGTWKRVLELTPPSTVLTNAIFFNTTKSYADRIGSGTFRVGATFSVGGNLVTRRSEQRSF